MKCLIVEDEPISSRIMERLMSRYASSDAACNGQEALDMFLGAHEVQSPYDLILMDIMMTVVNGLEAVLQIREKETLMNIPVAHRVKIIMTTSLDDPRTVIKALYGSEANSYLIKPIAAQKLAEELRKIKLL